MKSIISSTWDDKYMYFIPIVTFCWQKLGIDTICFMPNPKENKLSEYEFEFSGKTGKGIIDERYSLIINTLHKFNGNLDIKFFTAPEHKEATYAQCARLYGSCLDLPEDEILITGDCDMANFAVPPYDEHGFTIFGSDLVPPHQFPMCYLSATVKNWRAAFEINDRTYQQCLDDLLGHIEAEHYRGNFWGKDQETAYNQIATKGHCGYRLEPRSNGENQFATRRLDRDDAYLMERDVTDVIDFHLPRPGYEHFEKIIAILGKIYPQDDFTWLETFNSEYKKLL